jgi:hypothetical protein
MTTLPFYLSMTQCWLEAIGQTVASNAVGAYIILTSRVDLSSIAMRTFDCITAIE